MNVVRYNAPCQFEITEIPLPKVGSNSVLVKVRLCGLCASDKHQHEGSFFFPYPYTPGHEVVGVIEAVGEDVIDIAVGDRCVVDPIIPCERCFFCRRNTPLYCERFSGLGSGTAVNGGFAQYVSVDSKNVYKFSGITDEEAVFIEPLSNAIHGLDRVNAPVGIEALVLGSGPSGLMFAQLLKISGASKVVLAANKGKKLDLAKEHHMADEYIEIDRENPVADWEAMKNHYSYGFDVVIEATGSAQVANDAIHYVRRGGTLLLFSVYSHSAVVSWSPAKIFSDEIKIVGSMCQNRCFSRSVAYLESGKIAVEGMVTDTFDLKDYGAAMDRMNSRDAMKIVLKPL